MEEARFPSSVILFWLIFSGIPMAVEAAVLGAVLCVTIIGIPFWQCSALSWQSLL